MPSKTTKDTNAPKKPLSAYLLFSADERPKLKASGLDNFAEMSKALGAAWKQADQKTRAHYEKEHEKDKIRYENEVKQYEKSGPVASTSSKSTTKTDPPSKSKAATTKKTTPAVKNGKNKTEDKEEEEEDDDEEESEEEEPTPAPPAKSSRKKN